MPALMPWGVVCPFLLTTRLGIEIVEICLHCCEHCAFLCSRDIGANHSTDIDMRTRNACRGCNVNCVHIGNQGFQISIGEYKTWHQGGELLAIYGSTSRDRLFQTRECISRSCTRAGESAVS